MSNETTREVKIKSLQEFITEIDVNEKSCPIGGDVYLYRGHSDKEYNLVPSIARKINNNTSNNLLDHEADLINQAKLQMPEIFANIQLPSVLLTKLQHYGIPTRLLDFTENSLVGLFFACQISDNKDTDGEVIVIKKRFLDIWTCYSTKVNIISNTYLKMFSSAESIDKFFQKIKNDPFFNENEKYVSNETLITHLMEPMFFKSEYLAERHKRQMGVFVIFPNKVVNTVKFDSGNNAILIPDTIDNQELYEFKNSDPCIIKRITVPHQNKVEILDQLAQLGITKSFLFPEPENICKEIYNTYKKRYFDF